MNVFPHVATPDSFVEKTNPLKAQLMLFSVFVFSKAWLSAGRQP